MGECKKILRYLTTRKGRTKNSTGKIRVVNMNMYMTTASDEGGRAYGKKAKQSEKVVYNLGPLEHEWRFPPTKRHGREHQISLHLGQRGNSLPGFLQVEHWTIWAHNLDLRSIFARIGWSSLAEGGDVGGAIPKCEEGVVRVIYGI